MKNKLMSLCDETYKEFNSSLIPNLPKDRFVGVRTPILRKIAKETDKAFMEQLPHSFFEEDQIHAFMISEISDFSQCIYYLERFLPYVNNWATCDQMSPKIFVSHKTELLPYIRRWLYSEHCYTVRFGVNMLMRHFLSDDFNSEYLQWVASIKSSEYYVNMVRAWYFATALATNWDDTFTFLCLSHLDKWTHNKTVQKAIESRRITDEQKKLLRDLRRR